jgi:small subunit ribosomal protein S5
MPRQTSKRKNNRKNQKGRRKGRRRNDKFDTKIVSIRRVSRMYKGGRRLRLSVMAVVGDKKGKVGVAIGKGSDVKSANEKAINQAKKNLVEIPVKGNTIPHEINYKKGAAKIFLKPATPGTGVIAGSAVRAVIEVAGIKDVYSKILGTNNKVSNVYATIEALSSMIKDREKPKAHNK